MSIILQPVEQVWLMMAMVRTRRLMIIGVFVARVLRKFLKYIYVCSFLSIFQLFHLSFPFVSVFMISFQAFSLWFSYSQTVHKKGGDPDTDKNNHRESQVGDERGISIDPRDRKSISLTSAKQGGLFGDFLQMLFPSHLLLYLAAGKGKFQLSSKFTSFPWVSLSPGILWNRPIFSSRFLQPFKF